MQTNEFSIEDEVFVVGYCILQFVNLFLIVHKMED